ncbi:hypothetical protein [Methylobacterium aquaticum]|uniref:hypothetical protein n=1 Tax=Methylobacterium aquaticum TaxID=270351 RepID=UPI0019325192|nr:hypothetical protein [Methylobacterium aquaticum]QRE78241.1 hypothetical protein F1D61_32970 [Methylobacterium aquaticum]QRE78261.1 hypothetical protein F1D61_33080 [Methylobacterium aquaticum]
MARQGEDNSRPWAQAFFAQTETLGLSLATLNRIVAECDTHAAAMAQVEQKLAAGEGSTAVRGVAREDTARRIGAAHAKAHQPKKIGA